MEVMPYSAAMAGLSSTFTLTTSTFSLYSTEISSRIGPSLRQGPHHSAQKSTMTGFSEASTSVLKLASVTSFALLITFVSLPLVAARRLGVEICEVVLDVEGRHTTGTGGGDGLAVGRINDVAGSEDALDAGLRGAAVHGDGSLCGQLEFALDQIGAGIVSDCHEHSGYGQFGFRAVHQVLQPQCGDFVPSQHVFHTGVPHKVDLLVGQGAVSHDLRSAQGIAAVDYRDGLCELGEEQGLFHGRVAATENRNVLVLEEETVAGCTPAHTVARKPLLVRQAEFAVGRAGGKNDRTGLEGPPRADGDGLDVALEVQGGDVLKLDLRAETGRLL